MHKKVLINTLAVIGVGLIGGSLARALRQSGHCARITGYGRSTEQLEEAVSLGVIDEYSSDLTQVVADADVIVLATPLAAMEALLSTVAMASKADAIITDVGSAKGSVVRFARTALGKKINNFIPGHPIAGTEKSGVEASFPELFQKHMVILTPLEENTSSAVDLVTRMWEACGAHVVSMAVEEHDQILAATSHLPHVLAYALVDCLASMNQHDQIFRFSAGGFRDFTRIASSSPEMWADICISNRDNLLAVTAQFKTRLDQLTEHIAMNDRDGLIELFSRARNTREVFLGQRDTLLTGKPDRS